MGGFVFLAPEGVLMDIMLGNEILNVKSVENPSLS